MMRIKLKALSAGDYFSFLDSEDVWKLSEGSQSASLVCGHGTNNDAVLIGDRVDSTVTWLTEEDVSEHAEHYGFLESEKDAKT